MPPKIVLTTGANSGIGFETVVAFGAQGPKYHVLLGVRTLSKGADALDAIKSRSPSGNYSLIQLDVTKPDSIQAAVATVTKDHAHLDVLLNNAGIVSYSPDLLTNLRDTFETNTFGAALVTQEFLPLLEKAEKPRIVYTSSGLGSLARRANPKDQYTAHDALSYRMSKAALNMLMISQSTAFGLEGKKTRLCAYEPGYTISNLSGGNLKENGAHDTDIPAKALAELVDGGVESVLGQFVQYDGEIVPW